VHGDVKPADVAAGCVAAASKIVKRRYGIEPAVNVRGQLNTSMVYVPSHMRVILYEVRHLVFRLFALY
jgi:hypothetical protein